MSAEIPHPADGRLVVVEVPLRRIVDESYRIFIGWGLASAVADYLSQPPLDRLRLAVVADAAVSELWTRPICEELTERGRAVSVLTMPAGEQSKTREVKAHLEDQLIEAGFGRDSCLLAVGGGVVSDLAGFVAGTFARGVPIVNYPTTLLAAADAGVGGKTGVDTAAGTNLIGLFHQPKAVFIDLATWRTLPEDEVRNGLAETVTHACLADARLFELLEATFVRDRRTPLEAMKDRELCERIAVQNCEIKRSFVIQDVAESNLRMALNLGHTFGRALEAALDYKWSHGKAVAVGLCMQARLGREYGYVTGDELGRLVRLLEAIGLPTMLPSEVSDDLLLAKVGRDKKVRGGVARFVFQRGIGDFVRFEDGLVSTAIGENDLRLFLKGERAG